MKKKRKYPNVVANMLFSQGFIVRNPEQYPTPHFFWPISVAKPPEYWKQWLPYMIATRGKNAKTKR